MDWTVKDVHRANHNPQVVVNGQAGKAPIAVDAAVGRPVTLDASGSTDPDGNALKYTWFFYAEAGTGVPGHPVSTGPAVQIGGGGSLNEGGIPSAGEGGAKPPPARIVVRNEHSSKATVIAGTPGIAHVILAVEDNGTPSLTSYRRVILTISK
jgi:hypothetical protein